MTLLVINIKLLAGIRDQTGVLRGCELAILPGIKNAFLLIEDNLVADYGPMHQLVMQLPQLPPMILDAAGQYIFPCWCDSHTHILFAGSREDEFVDKIKGLTYTEIAARGGGILNSAKKMNEISEDALFNETWQRLQS
ncbi:MAG: hypothetical protein WKI04_18295 [Ferruginibacter sp.]